jgi:hypothetical protein
LSGSEDAAQLKQIVTDVKVIDGVNKQKNGVLRWQNSHMNL